MARSLLNARLKRLGNADEAFFEDRKNAFLTAEKMRMFAESELGAVCVYSAQTFHGGFMHLLLDCREQGMCMKPFHPVSCTSPPFRGRSHFGKGSSSEYSIVSFSLCPPSAARLSTPIRPEGSCYAEREFLFFPTPLEAEFLLKGVAMAGL